MALEEIKATLRYPEGTTQRYKDLDALDQLLAGTIYSNLLYSFDVEEISGQYIKIKQRRPSSPFNLARIVVDQTSGLLFGGEQMPLVKCGKPKTDADGKTLPDPKGKSDEANVSEIVQSQQLDALMMEVYDAGASGSAAVIVRRDADGNPWYDVVPGKHGMPIYDPLRPTKMIGFVQVWPVKAKELRQNGELPGTEQEKKDVGDDDDYFCRLTIDAKAEQRYIPLTAADYAAIGQERNGKKIDWVAKGLPFPHRWGIVPVIWGKNLIGGGNAVDGTSTFAQIADIQVEIAYNLSQIGRGFRYTADPLLARKRGQLDQDAAKINPLAVENSEMTDDDGKTVRSSSNVLELGSGDDAFLIELQGTGLTAFIEFVKMMREWALEIVGAMKSDSETTKGVQSGRALEMLYQAMQLLIKRQRIAWGTRFLIPLLQLLLRGCANGFIKIEDVKNADPDVRMSLKWPQWMTPRGSDLLATAQAAQSLAGGSTMSPVVVLPQPDVSAWMANELGFADPSAMAEEAENTNDELAEQARDDAAAALAAKSANGPGGQNSGGSGKGANTRS